MKIYAPVKDANGTWCSVRFTNGVGETDDPYLIEWFKSHGYKVPIQSDSTEDNKEEVKPTNTTNNINEKYKDVDFESMTPNQLREWLCGHGYGTRIKNTRSKEKLLNILREV